MRPLHILYFIERFNIPETATGLHAYQLALRWLERGHKVTVVTSVPKNDAPQCTVAAEMGDRFRVIRLTTSGLGQALNDTWPVVVGLLRSLFIGKIDVIYSSSNSWTAALPGYLLSFFNRRPLYFEICDGQPAVHQFVQRLFYRRADRVVALTEGARQHAEKLGKPLGKILTVANGVEDWGLSLQKRTPPELPLDRDKHFICSYVGAHENWSKLETVLECASRLKGTNVRFLLIGDGREKIRLKRDAMRRKLDNVRFCGPMPKKEVLNYLAGSNVALICTKEHPFQKMVLPHKIFDYMLAGCPVVAAARGEVIDLIERADCGWWVQPERPQELADLIDTIRQIDPNELRKKGARGRDFLLRYYLRRDLADKLEKTFLHACMHEVTA